MQSSLSPHRSGFISPHPTVHQGSPPGQENAPIELPTWHREYPLRWPGITFAKPATFRLYPPRYRAAILMKKRAPVAPTDPVESHILTLRGKKVILDSDLAAIYGVTTKRLNEQIKRNSRRFPSDFLFRLNRKEAEAVMRSRSQIATLKRGQNIKFLPYVFTETGAIMAASVLNSPQAVRMSVFVVRAFIQMRELFFNHKALSDKLAELDARIGDHDQQLSAIVQAIRQLAAPGGPQHGRKIGFNR